jgi:hypothetical protein
MARAEGLYWVCERKYRQVVVAAYRDGWWMFGDGDDLADERGLMVLAGPLQPPDPAIGATWKERYEKILTDRKRIEGRDPTLGWNYLDGYYWVRVPRRSELVLASFAEDAWDEVPGEELHGKIEVIDGPLTPPPLAKRWWRRSR